MVELFTTIIFFAGFGVLGWTLIEWVIALVWVNVKEDHKSTSQATDKSKDIH
jgi:hypothetical protein